MKSLKSMLVSALVVAGAALFCTAASAQAWPDRVVRIISTAPPGGSIDLLSRALADDFSKTFGKPFIVETRTGGNGNIGVDLVLKQPADGHLLFVAAPGPFAINQNLYSGMPFNPATDIAPITMLAFAPLVLVVHPSVPAGDLKELSAWMKTQGGKVNYSSQAVGSTGHLAMELFKVQSGLDATHIPYKSSANEATLALISGTVQLSFVNTSTVLPQIAKGALRPIGVAELKRISSAPDIPTLAEQGLKGFEATPWLGLGTRAGVPRDIINRIAERAAVALQQPEVAKRMANLGIEPRLMTPDEFGQYVKTETAKWADVIKRSGAKAD
jgi:tripartite-type tricarboxylate transporter receptor subunit TctC